MFALSSDRSPNPLHEAANRLAAALDSAVPCEPVRELIPVHDLDSAYQVQDRVIAQLEIGTRRVGRKIGLTSKAVQKQLGVDQPDCGVLLASMAFCDQEEVPTSRLLQPRVEAEVAFVLEHDLDVPSPTLADVIRATAYVLPAIEVVDSRVKDWNISIVDTVADNASSGVFVLGGSPVRVDQVDLRLCGMSMERDGVPVSTGCGAACLGNPLNAVVWLARHAVTIGRPLRAGEILLSGALGPMVPVRAGATYNARISGIGSVSASFSQD